jgi:hypothetical protein
MTIPIGRKACGVVRGRGCVDPHIAGNRAEPGTWVPPEVVYAVDAHMRFYISIPYCWIS